ALMRQEIVACPAAQFAEFVLRWQGVHPATRQEGADGIASTLSRLEGLPLPAELWEATVLPARGSNCQSRGLDGPLASGTWVWACQGSEDRSPGLLAFWQREHLAQAAPPDVAAPFSVVTDRVLTSLQQRGASFTTDLVSDTGLSPAQVRASLWELIRR